jgi:hypothetical protein
LFDRTGANTQIDEVDNLILHLYYFTVITK